MPMPSQKVTSGPANNAAPASITIKDFKYEVPASVSPGQKINVMNSDSADHTITADNGASDVQTPLKKLVSFTAPTKPGTYTFGCAYHRSMHGTLVVK